MSYILPITKSINFTLNKSVAIFVNKSVRISTLSRTKEKEETYC